jgi:hypothetical protein
MWLALGKKHETLPEKITKAKRVGGLSCRSKGKVHYPHPKKNHRLHKSCPERDHTQGEE